MRKFSHLPTLKIKIHRFCIIALFKEYAPTVYLYKHKFGKAELTSLPIALFDSRR